MLKVIALVPDQQHGLELPQSAPRFFVHGSWIEKAAGLTRLAHLDSRGLRAGRAGDRVTRLEYATQNPSVEHDPGHDDG
jgi:hypothetical protein